MTRRQLDQPSRTFSAVIWGIAFGALLALAACAAPPASTGGGAASRATDQPTAGASNRERSTTGEPAGGSDVASVPIGLAIGDRAPSFSVVRLDGRQVSDADLRAEGKPFILYFYATW